jgi:sensor histidine kinase YesM
MTRRLRRAAVVLGVWTLPALVAWSQSFLGVVVEPASPPPVWRLLPLNLVVWWYWAAWTPAIAALRDRFPLERGVRGRSLAVHGGAALGAGLLHSLVNALAVVVVFEEFVPANLWRLTLQFVQSRAHFSVLTYLATVGILSAATFARRLAERERTAAELRERLTEAELSALKAQLQPHFLFNTLHAIGVLIREDPSAAALTVTRLGDLLRRTLEGGGTHEVALRHEIEMLRLYLDIQQTRFSDRLTVRVTVPDLLMDAMVPAFVLQPLVENALRHGVEPRSGPALVTVEAARQDGMLVLEIRDDGPGFRPGHREGVGLRNTRARLAALYGDRQRLELADRPEGGAAVTVRLPFRRAGGGPT